MDGQGVTGESLAAQVAAVEAQRDGWAQQFLDMREALSAAGVDHIGKSIADSIRLLACERDAAEAGLVAVKAKVQELATTENYMLLHQINKVALAAQREAGGKNAADAENGDVP